MSDPDETNTADPDAKLKHVVSLLGKLLVARKDVKAIEHEKYGWMPDRERAPRGTKAADMPCIPMRMQDFREHLFEKRCMGTYLLDLDNNVKFFALDVDLKTENAAMFVTPDLSDWDKVAQDYKRSSDEDRVAGLLDIDKMYVGNLEEALHNENHVGHRWARLVLRDSCEIIEKEVRNQLGLPSLTVITGGGAHVLVPLGNLTPAVEARAMANVVMEATGYELFKGDCFWRPKGNDQSGLEIEVFPKQDKLGDSGSFGNLIRLPMGWHLKANMRTYFLDTAASPIPPWNLPKLNAVAALEQAATTVGIGV